jgi:hypothetical protein
LNTPPFLGTVLALCPIIVYLALGFMQQHVVAERVAALGKVLDRANPEYGPYGLEDESLTEALSGDIDRVQVAAAVLSSAPVFVVLFHTEGLLLLLLLLYVPLLVWTLLGRRPTHRVVSSRASAAPAPPRSRWSFRFAIDTDQALVGLIVLAIGLIATFGVDVYAVATGGGHSAVSTEAPAPMTSSTNASN